MTRFKGVLSESCRFRLILSTKFHSLFAVAMFFILAVVFLVHHTFYSGASGVSEVASGAGDWITDPNDGTTGRGPNNKHRDAFMKEKAEANMDKAQANNLASYQRRESRRRARNPRRNMGRSGAASVDDNERGQSHLLPDKGEQPELPEAVRQNEDASIEAIE